MSPSTSGTLNDGVVNTDIFQPTDIPLGASEKVDAITEAICAVMAQVGGIEKTQAPGLKYKFLSEESITTALRGLMAANGLMVIPRGFRVIEREEYKSGNGADMTRFLIRQVFRIAHKSGQWIEGSTAGEATDSGDKCLNKCMTAAYKYFLRETFAISGGDDPDFHDNTARARPGAAGRGAPANGHAGNAGQNQGGPRPAQGNTNAAPQNQQPANGQPAAAGPTLLERATKCVGMIQAATEHAQVASYVRAAESVGFAVEQLNWIKKTAAHKRLGWWAELAASAPDLETLDAIQTGAGPILSPFPELLAQLAATCRARAEAVVAPQADATYTAPASAADGTVSMPYSDVPVSNVDF